MLTWLHFGDLHASDEDGWESLARFGSMIDDVNANLGTDVDFAFLPGDNANHGTLDQYRRIRGLLDRLQLPWHVIPGDHDFEPGQLNAFHAALGAQPLPYGIVVGGHRCLFLDIVSHGGGGPDFRLGPAQARWLHDQLEASRHDGGRPVVFMHAFAGDLAEGAETIGRWFAEHDVVCVDTGHTHYNELLNDGRVIYTATRSTGQIEEGPAGFSLHAVDGLVLSWRFKEAARPWPFVLITSPADHRLVTDTTRPEQIPAAAFTVRAKVFGRSVVRVSLSAGGNEPVPMQNDPGTPGVWQADLRGLADGLHDLRVEASDDAGHSDSDTITVQVKHWLDADRTRAGARLGQDSHSIGGWPAHGIVGSQLGPNKNGRKW